MTTSVPLTSHSLTSGPRAAGTAEGLIPHNGGVR
jgi:hypothetical protein